jgi:hypothetical protein
MAYSVSPAVLGTNGSIASCDIERHRLRKILKNACWYRYFFLLYPSIFFFLAQQDLPEPLALRRNGLQIICGVMP